MRVLCNAVARSCKFKLLIVSLCRPVEVPCLRMKHRLVGEVPLKPEPFQIPESELVSPKVRSKKHGGSVVYSNPLGPEKYVSLKSNFVS